MNREQYRLRDYFDRLEGRQEITEIEFRSLVEHVSKRMEQTEPQPFTRNTLMKSSLILLALLLGGGILWYTGGTNSSPDTISPSTSNNLSSTEKRTQTGDPSSPLLPFANEAEGEGKENSIIPLRPSGSHSQAYRKDTRTYTSPRQELPWGYRFVPGQRLVYEWTFDHDDPQNNDAYITHDRATIDVESVAPNGNFTLLITTEHISHQWKNPEAEKMYASSTVFGSTEQFRAIITPLGKFVDGEILNDEEEQEWLVRVNRPDFQGGMRRLPSSTVEHEVEKWIPAWPARNSFDGNLKAVEKREEFDTVEVTYLDELDALYNDPSRHLDTIGKAVLYVSARARGIVPDSSSITRYDPTEEEEAYGVVAFQIEDKTGQTSEEAIAEEKRERQRRDSIKANPTISREATISHYTLDRSSLATPSEALHISREKRFEEQYDRNSMEDFYWRESKNQFAFRKTDGALELLSEQGNTSWKTSSTTSLRLIRSEMPEAKKEVNRPSIR